MEDYKHPDLVTSKGLPLELDLFYPQLNLAFEYQVEIKRRGFVDFKGVQHFKNVEIFSNAIDESRVRDKLKSELCKEKGIFYFCREILKAKELH